MLFPYVSLLDIITLPGERVPSSQSLRFLHVQQTTRIMIRSSAPPPALTAIIGILAMTVPISLLATRPLVVVVELMADLAVVEVVLVLIVVVELVVLVVVVVC